MLSGSSPRARDLPGRGGSGIVGLGTVLASPWRRWCVYVQISSQLLRSFVPFKYVTNKLGSLEPTGILGNAQILTNPHLLSPEFGVFPRILPHGLPELSLGCVSGVTLGDGVSALACTGNARAAPLLWRGRAVLGDGLTRECPQDGTQGGGSTSALTGTALPFPMGRGMCCVSTSAGERCPNVTETAQGQYLGVRNQPA